MADKLVKLNDQFLHIECSRGIGTIAIRQIDEVWAGTVSDPNEDVTQICLIGRPPIQVEIPHKDVESIIAGPPDPRQQILALVDEKPQVTLNYGLGELIIAEPEELSSLTGASITKVAEHEDPGTAPDGH